jgi:predicted NAD/FAD-dependent oxidoreductase
MVGFVCRGSAFPKTFIAKEERCLVDQDMSIAVCGDFCVGPNVESAILSGLAAAEKIESILAVDAKL